MQETQFGMRLRRIIEASTQAANDSGVREAQKGHADGLRGAEIEEVGGRECPAMSFASNAIGNGSARCHGRSLLSELSEKQIHFINKKEGRKTPWIAIAGVKSLGRL
jgi:hypothetical protein